MATKVTPETFSTDELIQVIKTGRPGKDGLGKMRALAALRQGASPQKVQVFSEILTDANEMPRFKHMAALGLYELGGRAAEQALVRNAPAADPLTAATVALALGRIGAREAMPVIRQLRATASAASKASVDFSLALLAYRHNLDGHEVKLPPANQLAEIPAGSRALPIKVDRAPNVETKLALAALGREPVAVDLDPETGQQIVCQPNTFVFLWNRQFAARRIGELKTRKGVVGLLFLRSRFEDAYSLAAFALGAPKGDRVEVTLHRASNGQVEYAGAIALDGNQGRFELRTVKRPGGSAIAFRGSIDNGQFVMAAAESALTALERRKPQPAPELA